MNRLPTIVWLVVWLVLPAAFLAALLSGCNSDYAAIGKRKFEARDWSAAVEELGWAVKKNPQDHVSRYLLGRAQSNLARTRFDAKATFRELRKSPEWRKPAMRNLVGLLLRENNFDAAETVIAEELSDFPDDPDWLEIRGLAAVKRLDFESADYQKRLQDVVGEGAAKWALDLIALARTIPDQKAYDEHVNNPIRQLQTHNELRDSTELKAFTVRSRTLGLRAQADFTAAADKKPLAFRALTELGQQACDRDDVDDARKRLMAVISIDESALPDAESKVAFAEQHSRAVDLLSNELEKARLLPESIALLAAEQKKGQLPPTLQQRLARQYFENGQLEEMAAIVDEILTRDPNGVWGNYLRGQLAATAGKELRASGKVSEADAKDEEAIIYFKRALVIERTESAINAALARACARVGKLAQADENFAIALGQGLGTDVDTNIEYARLLARTTDVAQAAQYLEGRLKSVFPNPDSPEHQRILAEIRSLYQSLGLKADTLFEAQNAVKLNPRNVFAKLALANLEAAQGLRPKALAHVRDVTAGYPGMGDAWHLQGKILIDLGRHAEALRALDHAAKLLPDDPNIPWNQGRAHLALKHMDEARASLKRALEIDPKLGGPRLDLAEVELQDGRFEAADQQARILLERFPEDRKVHRVLGLARLGMNDPQGAIPPLRRATDTRPGDPWLRLRLAEALIASGARKEGATEFVTIASDASVPRDVRGLAARNLVDQGSFAEAADAFTALLESATTENERVDLSKGLFQAKMSAGNLMGALDELVQMRLTGRSDPADRLLVVAAGKTGNLREAAAQADLLRSRDAHDVDSLQAAADAHAATGQWSKAVDDLNDLGRLQPEHDREHALARAKALVALGRLPDAAKIADAPDSRPDADRSKALRLKLDIAAAADADPAAIEHALRAVLAVAPGEADAARLVAAKALAAQKRLDLAAPILSSAPLRAPTEDGAVLAGAILVAAGDLTGAAALLDANLDRGPRVAEARGLVSVLLDKTPPAGALLATFLDRVAQRDVAAAREAAAALREPESIRELWTSVARNLPGKGDELAGVRDLARARLYVDSRLFADEGFTIVRGLAERAGALGSSFDLLRAWWKLEVGAPKPAADIVVPMLERDGRNAAVLLIASLAGIALGNLDAPRRFIDGTIGTGAVPEAFLRDLSRAAAASGQYATALRALSKIQQPSEDDRVLRLLIAVERRDANEALSAAKALSAQALARPALSTVKLWVGVQHPETKPAAAAGIKALVALPRDLERADLPLLYEAALVAGLKTEAAQILDFGLAKAGLSAEGINRYASVLQRLRVELDALDKLQERLAVLDPTGKLRVAPPKKITLEK